MRKIQKRTEKAFVNGGRGQQRAYLDDCRRGCVAYVAVPCSLHAPRPLISIQFMWLRYMRVIQSNAVKKSMQT